MSNYVVYFDETGDFIQDPFFAISGFVWENKTGSESLSSCMKNTCKIILSKLQAMYPEKKMVMPASLHTTESVHLRTLLTGTTLLESILEKKPLQSVLIYANANDLDPEDIILDGLYNRMLTELITEITYHLRLADPSADISFFIPSRNATFDAGSAMERDFSSIGAVVSHPDLRTAQVAVNEPTRFIQLGQKLNVLCSVRMIEYKYAGAEKVDEADQKANGSSLWGYYVADLLNAWMRKKANNSSLSPEEVRKAVSLGKGTLAAISYSREWKQARDAVCDHHASSDPLNYMKVLSGLEKKRKSSPNLQPCLDLLYRYNPFSSEAVVSEAVTGINREYIYQNDYSTGMRYASLLKNLLDQKGNVNFDSYHRLIKIIINCHHHQGADQKALTLFQEIIRQPNIEPVFKMDLCNGFAEFFANTLAFEQGISYLQDVLSAYTSFSRQDSLGGISLGIPEETETQKLVRGRTLSSLGGLYSYLGRSEEAGKLFTDAIDLFRQIGSPDNIAITRSHMIHMLLDQELAVFEPETVSLLNQLFTGKEAESSPPVEQPGTWETWYLGIQAQYTQNGVFSPERASYHLWLFLKAMSSSLPQLTAPEAAGLRQFFLQHDHGLQSMLKTARHPAEMLLKHHALIMCEFGEMKAVKKDLGLLKAFCDFSSDAGMIPLLCRVAVCEITRRLNALPLPEEQNLVSGVHRDIDFLWAEVSGLRSRAVASLIDRLHENPPETMDSLLPLLRYEYR